MVFHEIDSITSVISGHRVIVYFVEGKPLTDNNDIRLRMILETLMEMMQKKNDDMLVVKVLHSSPLFEQFTELYMPEVTGIVTLFVVNNEGIPIICEQIIEEDTIPSAIESLSTICKLNPISRTEISKIKHLGTKATVFRSNTGKNQSSSTIDIVSKSNMDDLQCGTTEVKSTINLPVDQLSSSESTTIFSSNDGRTPSIHPDYTNLQIRLSDGSRSVRKFEKNSTLKDVWVFISTKYNLKNFNLKTYERSEYFSEPEYEMTLAVLGLCPNGVLIVVDKNVVPYSNNGVLSIVQYSYRQAMNKTTSFFFYIQGLLLMFWNTIFSNNGSPRPAGSGMQRRQINEGSSSDSSSVRERRPKSTKQVGNVHTLRRSEDSDDENNRYNGNSTQQQ